MEASPCSSQRGSKDRSPHSVSQPGDLSYSSSSDRSRTPSASPRTPLSASPGLDSDCPNSSGQAGRTSGNPPRGFRAYSNMSFEETAAMQQQSTVEISTMQQSSRDSDAMMRSVSSATSAAGQPAAERVGITSNNTPTPLTSRSGGDRLPHRRAQPARRWHPWRFLSSGGGNGGDSSTAVMRGSLSFQLDNQELSSYQVQNSFFFAFWPRRSVCPPSYDFFNFARFL